MGLVAVASNVILVSGDTEPRSGLITDHSWRKDDSKVTSEGGDDNEGTVPPLTKSESTAPDKEIKLEVKKQFKCFEDVKDFVNAYQEQSRSAFAIRTSTQTGTGPVVYVCKHGARRKSRSLNVRPNQSTVKLGCGAQINFYRRMNGTYSLTKFTEEHANHEVSEEVFQQDTAKVGDKNDELIKTLMEGNSKPGQIADVIEKRHGERFNSRQVRYRMKQLLGPNKENEELEELLTSIEAEGGRVRVLRDDQEHVRCLTIATSDMVSAFRGSNPSVVNIDTTFKFENSGHKLCAAAYLNPVTGNGEIAQFMFLADECDETYQFAYDSFKDLCLQDPPVLLVDKVGQFTHVNKHTSHSALSCLLSNSKSLVVGWSVGRYKTFTKNPAYGRH